MKVLLVGIRTLFPPLVGRKWQTVNSFNSAVFRYRFGKWNLFPSNNSWKAVSSFACKPCDCIKRNRISAYSSSSWYGRLQCSFSSSTAHGTVVLFCFVFNLCFSCSHQNYHVAKPFKLKRKGGNLFKSFYSYLNYS